MTTPAVIDWDSPLWGVPGHNVHAATAGADLSSERGEE